MEIGLQTFTVRKLMRTPEMLDQTFSALAGMGLKNLELAVDYLAFPFTIQTARMILAAAQKHGLQVRSCQIRYATAAANVQATISFMKELGADILTNSVIDLKLLNKGESGLLHYCEMLERLTAQLAASGIDLAHHNHHYEFLRAGEQSVLAFMAAHTSMGFALDTYWCQRGGGNILAWLEELKGRVPLLHLRDFGLSRIGLFTGGKDCEIGQGNIPFGAVLQAANAAGTLYGMVEQKTKTPMESLEISLKALGIEA